MTELAFRRSVVRRRWLEAGWRQPLAVVGATIALMWVVIAVFAPLIAPYGPLEQTFTAAQSPSLHRHVPGFMGPGSSAGVVLDPNRL